MVMTPIPVTGKVEFVERQDRRNYQFVNGEDIISKSITF